YMPIFRRGEVASPAESGSSRCKSPSVYLSCFACCVRLIVGEPCMSDEKPVSVSNNAPGGPDEPLLAMDDIQGIAVPGFLKPAQTLVGVRFRGEVTDFKMLLKAMAESGEIATARKTL